MRGDDMRIGFTGTQVGMTEAQKKTFTNVLDILGYPTVGTFNHGDCVGADAEAHAIAKGKGWRTICHPPTNNSKRAFTENDHTMTPYSYLERNQHIVGMAEQLIATPKGFEEELRSGTWATIRYAKKRGTLVRVIWPDGRVEIWG